MMSKSPSNRTTSNAAAFSPRISTAQIRLLERLCNACGVSGDEGEVRKIVLEQVRPHADEIKVDPLGNVLAVRRGKADPRLRVMIAAHMDEVGMMIIKDEGDGIFRFDTVGGVDAVKLAGKSVIVGRNHTPGVIGINPIHLSSYSERRRSASVDHLRIDVGPNNQNKIKPGDRAVFGTVFQRLGPSICAKAIDDRIGVATLIELFRHAPQHIDLLAAFTVQEEIGLRGARVAAYALNPDLAFVLDCTPARDLPAYDRHGFSPIDIENAHYNSRLGGGAAIYVADRATISDPRLIRYLTSIGDSAGIPYQLRQPGGGSTDAGAIHKQRSGIPSVSISVPGRYPHSGAMIVRIEDWKHTLALMYQALYNLPLDILKAER